MLVAPLLALLACIKPDSKTTPAETDTAADTTPPADDSTTTDSPSTTDTTTNPATPVDTDGDGHASLETGGGDCDDGDPRTYAGATESCDYADRDCDGDPWAPGVCDEVPQVADVAWATWLGNTDHSTSGQFGYGVAMAGDLDGDGWGDPFVMCWGCDAQDGYTARIGGFFVLENPEGYLPAADYADIVAAAGRYKGYGIDLDNPDRRDAIWVLPGRDGMPDGIEEWNDHALGIAAITLPENDSEDRSYFGWSLATGDLTKDGRDDVMIGDHLHNDSTGAVFVIPGWDVPWDSVRDTRK